MRFTIAPIVALAAGAFASSSSSAMPSAVTEVVTSYVTYCPEATSFVAGGSTVHVTTPGTYTLTGSYTVTRPMMTSTVTICNSCSATGSVGPTAPVPMGTGSYTTTTSSAPGSTSSTSPQIGAGAHQVAVGAGAGLAAVFGAAAFLL